MLPVYICLLALISSGFSLSEAHPWGSNRLTELSAQGNNYGTLGGQEADVKDHPYIASITYESHLFPAGAGAILNKHWVVSTAFTSYLPPQDMKMYIGTNNMGRSGQRLNVSKIIVHENFTSEKDLSYNIALLKTKKPMTFSDKVKPIKLAKSVPKAGADCTLLGYGYLQAEPYVGWDLSVASVQVKTQKQCTEEYGDLKTAFCAAADDVVPCYGDLGDLLMYKNKLVGFYVGGDYCNYKNLTEVYTNVPALKTWIWKTIQANSNGDEGKGFYKDQFYEA